jgi:hypothetical protein
MTISPSQPDLFALLTTQSAIIIFNLALVYHRQVTVLRREATAQNTDSSASDGTTRMQPMMQKANALYNLALKLIDDPGLGDHHKGTRFSIRLGIMNNLAHLEHCNKSTSVENTLCHLATLIDDMVCDKLTKFVDPSLLKGMLRNICSWTGISSSAAAAA